MPDDGALTELVRRARCQRCDGMGFRLAPALERRGERIPGAPDRSECPDCGGNGIRLGLCRRLGANLNRGRARPPS